MADEAPADFTRRDFLREGSLAAMITWMGGRGLAGETSAAVAEVSSTAPVVRCAVVGLGVWGRQILSTLTRIQGVEIAAVCDTYPGSRKRGGALAPAAAVLEDYGKLLEAQAVQGVVVATPSHRHAEIAVAALKAGKHVYCEAPLATTLEDARAIAQAAKGAAPGQVFQAGLQGRSDPQRLLAAGFFRAGTAGRPVMARAQWHKKTSWRQAAPTAEREREINWRLERSVSLGLIGEIAVHHLDATSWFFGSRPVAVSGHGALRHWREDKREIADTVHLVVEYPDGLHLTETLTLANSYDAEYEVFYGTDSAVLFRGGEGWMFREADAPLLGWEVHARKETFHRETGLVLVANASKRSPAPPDQGLETPEPTVPPLYHALEAFVRDMQEVEAAKADFVAAYGTGDTKALTAHLEGVPRRPGAGPVEGFESAVVAIKASEAVMTGRRIEFRPEWFELG